MLVCNQPNVLEPSEQGARMTDKELKELARFNNYPEEHMDLLVQWGRRVLMARRQFDLGLQAMNIRAAVMKEREACAKIVDENANACSGIIKDVLLSNADAIRARGNNDQPV